MADQKRVSAICSILTELADMAWRQQKLRYYACLRDAIDILEQKPLTLGVDIPQTENALESHRASIVRIEPTVAEKRGE